MENLINETNIYLALMMCQTLYYVRNGYKEDYNKNMTIKTYTIYQVR